MDGSNTIPDFIIDELAGFKEGEVAPVQSENVNQPPPAVQLTSFNLNRFKNACDAFVPNNYYKKLGEALSIIKNYLVPPPILIEEEPEEEEPPKEPKEEPEEEEKEEADNTLKRLKRFFNKLLKKFKWMLRKIRVIFKLIRRTIKRMFRRAIQKAKRRLRKIVKKITRKIRALVRLLKRKMGRLVKRIGNLIKRMTAKVGRYIRTVGRSAMRIGRRIGGKVFARFRPLLKKMGRFFRPLFEFISRVFHRPGKNKHKDSSIKRYAKKLSRKLSNSVQRGKKVAFKMATKGSLFLKKIIQRVIMKSGPMLLKILKVLVPFIKKFIKKLLVAAARFIAATVATAATVASGGLTTALAIISWSLLLYDIASITMYMTKVGPELMKVSGEMKAQNQYMADFETEPEPTPEFPGFDEPEEAEGENEFNEISRLEKVEQQNMEQLRALKKQYSGNPDASAMIDAEIRKVGNMSEESIAVYRAKNFANALEHKFKDLKNTNDRFILDDNGELKFTLENESEISWVTFCTKYLEYIQKNTASFGANNYFNDLYEKVNVKNFKYQVNDIQLPEFDKEGQMAVEEIKLILEKNEGIKGGALLSALNSNNFDFYIHTAPVLGEIEVEGEQQREKYNYFVDILIKLAGNDKGHKKLEV